MSERSHVSTALQDLDDADLRVEAQLGNEAAQALLLSRTLANLSTILSSYGFGSSVIREVVDLIKQAPMAPIVHVHSSKDERSFPRLAEWAFRDHAHVAANDEAWARLSDVARHDINVRMRVFDILFTEFWGIPLHRLSDASYHAFMNLRERLAEFNGASASATTTRANDSSPAVDEMSWDEFLGPLLSREDAMRRLEVASDGDFDDFIANRKLLALPVSGGVEVFPEFQFSNRGTVYPVVATVVQILSEVVTTPYTIASWFKGPKVYLEGESPIRWIELGRDPEPVIAGAQLAAAQLAQ